MFLLQATTLNLRFSPSHSGILSFLTPFSSKTSLTITSSALQVTTRGSAFIQRTFHTTIQIVECKGWNTNSKKLSDCQSVLNVFRVLLHQVIPLFPPLETKMIRPLLRLLTGFHLWTQTGALVGCYHSEPDESKFLKRSAPPTIFRTWIIEVSSTIPPV